MANLNDDDENSIFIVGFNREIIRFSKHLVTVFYSEGFLVARELSICLIQKNQNEFSFLAPSPLFLFLLFTKPCCSNAPENGP
jgi:hypothetical protein